MKKVFLLVIVALNLNSQNKAIFEMYFYFEDAAGNKDTIFFRADSSIIDKGWTESDNYNPEWGESIDNSPLDSTFEVRAKPRQSIRGDFYQSLINTAYDDGAGCIAPEPFLIFVYTKFWPVTMRWDQSYFRNHSCLYGSNASPDADMAKKWLFNDPNFPIRQIACLGNSNSYAKDLRANKLFDNFELPYLIEHEVLGKDKQDITAIRIAFGPPWLNLCDSLTSTFNPEQFDAMIYPTIATNDINIMTFSEELKTCAIIGIEGKIIREFIGSGKSFNIDVEQLAPGIYLLHLGDKIGRTVLKKFIKI